MELKHQMPIELEETIWGHHVFDQEETVGYHVYALAAREAHVQNALRDFQSHDLQVHHVAGANVALHNYLHYDWLEQTEANAPVAILDLGT